MKKILSLVLAAAMAVGMTVSSFAALGDYKVTISGKEAIVLGGDDVTLTVKVEDIKTPPVGGIDETTTTWAVTGNAKPVTVAGKTAKIELTSAAKVGDEIEVVATNAACDSETFTVKVVKANTGKIIGIDADKFTAAAEEQVNKATIEAGKKIEIPMTGNMFDWDDATTVIPTNVTDSQLRAGKITVKSTVSKGSSVIKKVEFDKGVLVIEFVDPYVSTKDTDFDFSVYLLKDKTRDEDTKFSVVGTLKNKEVLVYADDDEVYLGDGRYAKADAYIKSIKVDLGNDYYITTKMFEGKKYYGVADNEPTAADDDMLTKHPEIAVIYNIKSSGLTSGTATFDLDDKYYVYDKDGKYLGTTADKLAISSKYYLTTKKVDLTSAEEVEEEDDAKEAPVEEDKKPANNNPDTGVNGMVNVAVVAGVVALAAAGAVVLKK